MSAQLSNMDQRQARFEDALGQLVITTAEVESSQKKVQQLLRDKEQVQF